MADYWLLIRDPDGARTGVHLGDVDPGDGTLIQAAKTGIGVAVGDPLATGWDTQLTDGEPHPDWLVTVISWPPA